MERSFPSAGNGVADGMGEREGIRIHVTSLGCPKNLVDTERMVGALGPVLPVDDPARADLILVNTCGFIRPAIEESVAVILELARDKDPGSGQGRGVLAVTGCLVSRFGADLASDLVKSLPEVDLWLSTFDLDQWPGRVAKALGRTLEGRGRRLSTGPGWAYLKISEGCSHSCAFCTIPSIRGPHVSRLSAELVAEARDLLDQGARELVVVGQDVTAWGEDTGQDIRQLVSGLAGLAEKDDRLARLRLMYLYPAGLTESFLDFLKQVGPPLVPYFDVPLQHAHSEVLSRMGRPFARDPRRVVDRIRARFPDAALRTTLITGFPGETDEHFRALYDFVADVGFTHLGVFAYEQEEGTPAAAMPDQVDEAVRRERRDAVMELQAGISEAYLEGLVGQRLEVLVDAEHPDWPGLMTGRAWFQAPEVDGVTYVSAPPEHPLQPGDMVTAEIVESSTYDLTGLVEPEDG